MGSFLLPVDSSKAPPNEITAAVVGRGAGASCREVCARVWLLPVCGGVARGGGFGLLLCL